MKKVLTKIFKAIVLVIGIPFLIAKFAAVMIIIFIFLLDCFCTNSGKPVYSREMAPSPIYRSAEDFHKLTGVVFPQLALADSAHFDEGGFPAAAWCNEYKYVPDDGFNKDFFRKLDKACKEDSTHWSLTDSCYRYYILPDKDTVDRTKGMCDRMVKMEDGSLVPDWDGSFISVNIENDTIYLKHGWLR